MPFLYTSTNRSVQHGGVLLSPASADRTDKKLVPKCWNNERKLLAFAYHCSKMLRCGSVLLDHLCYITLMELRSGLVVIGPKHPKGIWPKVLFGV